MVKKLMDFLEAKSDVGIMLLVLNSIVMMWFALLHKQDLPGGAVTIILGIVGAKTTHGIMTNKGCDHADSDTTPASDLRDPSHYDDRNHLPF